MDIITAIMNRRSIRKFTEQEISDADVTTILKAGMAGPSCVNSRDWSFLVVKDPNTLQKMADANGQYAQPLRGARLGILLCGDLNRAFPPAKDYWIVDGSIAAQNMILAAKGLGIGSVWLGTWPESGRMEKQRQLFSLPEEIIPHSIIAFGYPAEEPKGPAHPEWEEDRVHFEKW